MTIYGGNYSNSFKYRQPNDRPGTIEQQNIVNDLLHLGFVSRGTFEKRKQKHLEWTEQSDYNNTFVHCQIHKVVFNGERFNIHQQQYYNNLYNDSPGYSQIVVIRMGDEEERLGVYVMDTSEYLKDLQTLDIKEKVS